MKPLFNLPNTSLTIVISSATIASNVAWLCPPFLQGGKKGTRRFSHTEIKRNTLRQGYIGIALRLTYE